MYGGLAAAVPLLPAARLAARLAARPAQVRNVMSPQVMSTSTEEESAMDTFTVTIPAGPLYNNDEAQRLGPAIAAAHFGTFTGLWTTVVENEMSVIQVALPAEPTGETEYTMDVPAGTIGSEDDAKEKCPAVCASYGGRWNGQWKTVIEGKLSVAGCVFKF